MINKEFKTLAISIMCTITGTLASCILFRTHVEAIILVGIGIQVCLIIFFYIYYDMKRSETLGTK